MPVPMNHLEMVTSLWERVRKPGLDMATLSSLIGELETALHEVSAANPEWQSKLRAQREEIPDLHRLVTRNFGPVLQGRLQDSLSKLKKLVTPEPIVPEATEENSAQPNETGETPQERKPFRNMPNLGMD